MSNSPLDVRLLAQEEIPEGAFPGAGGEDLRIYLAPTPHEQAWQHARRNRSVEVCGVLVGEWKRDAAGPFVEVRHIIESNAARSGPAEVTFTHDTWAAINREMDTRHQGLRIVGWYHTHPDFGIFLSEYDVFIHRHFFSGAGQIAWVLDPIRNQEGLFRWRDNQPVLTPQFWVGTSIRPAPPPPGAALPAMSAPSQRSSSPVPSAARGSRLLAGLDWSAFLQIAAVLLLGGMLGHMYAAWTDAERDQNHRAALTLEFFKTRLLRVGLEQYTHAAQNDLNQLASGLRRLEAQTKEPAGTTSEQVTSELEAMRRQLDQLAEKLFFIDRTYALSPREQEQLARFVLAQTGGRAPLRKGQAGRPPAEGGETLPPPTEASAPGEAAESQPSSQPGPEPTRPEETKSPPPVETNTPKTE
jgi:proteasome lid subunit RPN8/RPN11